MFRHADPREEDLERIASTPGVTVVDHSVSRAMLLEEDVRVEEEAFNRIDFGVAVSARHRISLSDGQRRRGWWGDLLYALGARW